MTAPQAASPRSSLPVSLTRFIGRERQLALAAERLLAGRLVTLVGPGGMGKTRLAIEAAGAWADANPADVWFVKVSPVTDSLGLERAMAAALEVRDDGKTPLGGQVLSYLRDGSSLIVMDNCEQMVEAVAEWAAAVLAACPDVRILATSREQLGIGGEVLIEVPPLDIESEALPLFEERAGALAPSLSLDGKTALAREICEQLDGMPLAIELAAARTRALSLPEIKARLSDRFALLSSGSRAAPERHRTLGAAVEWSYNLLPEKEAALYSRLSVFAGGCTLAAAEATCSGDGVPREEVVELLAHLVDRSMVVLDANFEPARYRMLETMRAHAASRLEDVERWQWRHFEWIWGLAREAGPALDGNAQVEWLDYLSQERDNIRAALSWGAGDATRDENCLEVVLGFVRLWWHRGPIAEGSDWLRRFSPSQEEGVTRTSVRARIAEGVLIQQSGDLLGSRAKLEQATDEARSLGEDGPLSEALAWLATTIGIQGGDIREAASIVREAAAAAAREGNVHGLGLLATARAFVHSVVDFDSERDLACVKATGDRWMIGSFVNMLGELARERGDLELARSYYREAIEWRQPVGGRASGRTWSPFANIAFVAMMQDDTAGAIEPLRIALRNAVDVKTIYGIGGCFEGVALLSALLGDHQLSARMIGAARPINTSIGLTPSHEDQAVVDRAESLDRKALGDAEFERLLGVGMEQDLGETVREAEEYLASAAEANEPKETSPRPGGLSRQEAEVLRLVASGYTNREIASTLVLSVRTVENHIANAYAKTNARGRAEATAWAIAHGLVATAQ